VAAGATASDVQDVANQILRDRRVNGATVTLVPANLSAVAEGEFFEVRVAAPTDLNAVLPGRFFRGQTLTSSARFMKELP
jgi:hypothetical protein